VDPEAKADDDIPIAFDVQTGWFGDTRWRHLRRLYVDYALDEDLEATLQIYRNFKNEVAYEKTLDGNTPAGEDPSIRDTIQTRLDMNVQGSFFSLRFLQSTEAEKFVLSKMKLILRRRYDKGQAQAA
jgi:hypothetical protein